MAVERMDDDRLASIIGSQIRDSAGYEGDDLSYTRTDSLARYQGEEYGDEKAGRSSVIDRSVLETVEQVMPSLVRTFLSNSEMAVLFEPQRPEDEEVADQASAYVNHVLMRENDGFIIAVDWMKSALITGTSVVKLFWDETEDIREETYSGLTEFEYQQLVKDIDIEVLQHTAFGRIDGTDASLEEDVALNLATQGVEDISATHDVKIRYTNKKAKLRWQAVPPEEFLVNKRCRTLNENDNTWSFACHRQARTVEDLLSEGFDEEKIERAASRQEDNDFNQTFDQRFADMETSTLDYADATDGQRKVYVYECYMRCDYDGDGVSELRRITVLGGESNTVILENEICEELPFAELTAIRRPHRLFGYSLAELTKDLQRLKTAIWRAMLDGLYLSLYPHRAIDESRVELDDLLSEDPGSIFRVNGDPSSAIVNLTTSWPGQQAFPMMQYIDSALVRRSGVNDLAGGLDSNALQGETARGVEEAANSARARVELIARTFAETGWTRLMRLALQMLNRHQNKEKVVRLLGKWETIDPRSWNTEMDVRINVGLGVGSKAEQVQKLNMIASKQEQLMGQLGINNPVAPLDKYYQTIRKMIEAADMDPETFLKDPTQVMQAQQGQQQPNPEAMKAQAEMAMKREEAQARLEQSKMEAGMRAETDKLKAQQEAEVARYRADLEAVQKREDAELKAKVDREIAANKLAFEYERMRVDHEYRMAELIEERNLEAAKMAAGSRDGQGNINLSN